jgi:antitoxin component YwqK of YwqJK toxin-antitoxin module
MLQNYILIDILQYVFNLYIDYNTQARVLENIIDTKFKFGRNCHISEKVSYGIGIDGSNKNVYIFLDNNLIKYESFFNKLRIKEENYSNNFLEGITTIWSISGKIKQEISYRDGIEQYRNIYNENGEFNFRFNPDEVLEDL